MQSFTASCVDSWITMEVVDANSDSLSQATTIDSSPSPTPSVSTTQNSKRPGEKSDGNGKKSRTGIGGKPHSSAWIHVTLLEEKTSPGGTKKVARCNYCKRTISAKPQRINNHLLKCLTYKDMTKAADNNSPELDEEAIVTLASSSPSSKSSSDVMKNPGLQSNLMEKRTVKQPRMNSFVLRTSPQQAATIDEAIAKFFFSCNLPFNAASSKYWLNTVQLLRPGYEPPSPWVLRHRLLNQVYDGLRSEMTELIGNSDVVIIQDGWSDIHNQPILTHCVMSKGKAYFLNSVECEAESKTAEYCGQQLEKAIQKVKQDFFAQVVGVTTDNAPVMQAMRDQIFHKYSDLLTYGCSPHMLHLLCKDITSVGSTMNLIIQVQRFFREHHKPNSLLTKEKGVKPVLPVDGRWGTRLDCIQTYIANRPKYIKIAQMKDEKGANLVSTEVAATVNSLRIYNEATKLREKLEPVTTALKFLEGDNVNIADALHCWISLRNHEKLITHRDSIKHRMDLAVSDFFFVAYALHPKYQGAGLTTDEILKVEEYLESKSPDYLNIFHAFNSKDEMVFPAVRMKPHVMESANPINWWTSMKTVTCIPNGLVDLLVRMYKCPAGSASIERIFSTFRFIQTKSRNRLDQEPLDKLAFCFRTLRAMDPMKEPDVEEFYIQ